MAIIFGHVAIYVHGSNMAVFSDYVEFVEFSDFSDIEQMLMRWVVDKSSEPVAERFLFLAFGSLNRGGNLFR